MDPLGANAGARVATFEEEIAATDKVLASERAQQLAVLNYLVHHSYGETARLLVAACKKHNGVFATADETDSKSVKSRMDIALADDPDGAADLRQREEVAKKRKEKEAAMGDRCLKALATVDERRQIRDCILSGDVDQAISVCQEHFPMILEADEGELHFHLCALKFIQFVVASETRLAIDFARDHLAQYVTCAFSDRVEEVVALLAYPEPASSPLANLVQPSFRDNVIARVNAAILRSVDAPARSSLETIVRHTAVLQDMVVGGDERWTLARFLQTKRTVATVSEPMDLDDVSGDDDGDDDCSHKLIHM